MNGIVEGGWEYVWAAYGLTVSALVIYGASVLLRLRSERRRTLQAIPVPVRREDRR